MQPVIADRAQSQEKSTGLGRAGRRTSRERNPQSRVRDGGTNCRSCNVVLPLTKGVHRQCAGERQSVLFAQTRCDEQHEQDHPLEPHQRLPSSPLSIDNDDHGEKTEKAGHRTLTFDDPRHADHRTRVSRDKSRRHKCCRRRIHQQLDDAVDEPRRCGP